MWVEKADVPVNICMDFLQTASAIAAKAIPEEKEVQWSCKIPISMDAAYNITLKVNINYIYIIFYSW